MMLCVKSWTAVGSVENEDRLCLSFPGVPRYSPLFVMSVEDYRVAASACVGSPSKQSAMQTVRDDEENGKTANCRKRREPGCRGIHRLEAQEVGATGCLVAGASRTQWHIPLSRTPLFV